MLVVPRASEARFLNIILNKQAADDLVIRLYSNNKTPAQTDTVAAYTEVSGGGYTSQDLSPASWTVVEATPSVAEHSQVEFAFTASAGQVYGYYITQKTGGALMWAERFVDGPYNIQNNGDKIRVTPSIALE